MHVHDASGIINTNVTNYDTEVQKVLGEISKWLINILSPEADDGFTLNAIKTTPNIKQLRTVGIFYLCFRLYFLDVNKEKANIKWTL